METTNKTLRDLVLLFALCGLSVAETDKEDAKPKPDKPSHGPLRDPRFRADARVYFKEEFDDDWAERWVYSKHYGTKQGRFRISAGKYYGDPLKDRGLQTAQNNRHYGISAKFDKFTNENKSLIIQFTMKKEQKIECGGMYLKLYSSDMNQTDLHSETPYLIMFGPDLCDIKRKLHIIFNYKGRYLHHKKDMFCRKDNFTHMYTFILRPERTYEVLVDNKLEEVGELESDWDFLPPKKIPQKKPADWDDRRMIDDPNHIKPADWDQPKEIADPFATIPEDWDFEIQGKWKPPKIPNPDYLGEWKQKKIENPNFMGDWIGKTVDNPMYVPDPRMYIFPDIGAIGIDVWQVKAGSIYDNIVITDDENYAKVHGVENFEQTKVLEKKMKERLDNEENWRKHREDRKKARKAEAIRRGIKLEDLPPEDDEDYEEERLEKEKKKIKSKKIVHDEL